ncbi:hypothetical protein F5884DRAFT_178988 [Xylogone sp. PMI_703]|nr:hypothetical protein F5884DRAFT_178988 [Xylogone sp. PMI_703]
MAVAYLDDTDSPSPGSPPELTNSKSSKSSSFHSSYQSDDNSVLNDASHFEDIGLDDDSRAEREIGDFPVKTSAQPYAPSYASDLRASTRDRKRVPMAPTTGNRQQRELTASNGRPAYPSLKGQVKSSTMDGLGLMPSHGTSASSRRGLMSSSTPSLHSMRRNRSTSPHIPHSPSYMSAITTKSRRLSWQSVKEKKTVLELEKECDEDDGDDVPDDCFLENVPISPRPPGERTPSAPASASTSPERNPKERVRSIGNGTSPVPVEQGSLKSPRASITSASSTNGQFPFTEKKTRAKSWTAALSELSEETKALTEALEAHAEDEEKKAMEERQRPNLNSRSMSEKPRARSAIIALPPLRRMDVMIDPLPISKEKEAVLSRTRPSWLPPKDPAEEKRHLKEYQKMMASSLEAERKREARRQADAECRDDTVSSLLRIWEEHVLPNWDNVTRQKRTRELWWRGIAPRSRGRVWERAIGNELELTESSFQAALRRAQSLEKTIKKGTQLSAEEERKKSWLDRIQKDVKNTYPELKIFQPDGPLYQPLVDVLSAYAMYRSDVGYVHGTSNIAALLLLNLPTPAATFLALSNILNRPLPLSFQTSDPSGISRAYSLLLSQLEAKSPRLSSHLSSIVPNPDVYLRDIFMGLFTEHLSLDNASRLWDVVAFEGDSILVRAGVAYLVTLEGKLLGTQSEAEVREIVSKGFDGISEEDWMRAVREAGKS